MSNADRDPHVLISARIGSHQKMLALPSHRARWGWIVMLGQAKLQRPPGVFASVAQLRFLAGEFRDCVTPWLDAKLLHAVPNLCDRCILAFGSTLEEGVVVVHDFKDHQERKSRTTEWRETNGVPNGHVNKGSPSVSPTSPGNTGETSSLAGAPARADAGALHSLSQSPSQEPGGGPGEPNAWDAYHVRTGEYPSSKIRGWLDELSEAHSEARVAAAISATPMAGQKVPDYLRTVRDKLRAADAQAERAERDQEKAAVARKRAPLQVIPAPADVTPEEARRLAAEFIEQARRPA